MPIRSGLLLSALLLGACSNRPVQYAINIDKLGEVLDLIKVEIGAYTEAYNVREAERRAGGRRDSTECNNGGLDFRLTEVAIHLTTTRTVTRGASADVSIPITSAGGSFGFGAAGSNATTNSQVLKFGSVIVADETLNASRRSNRPQPQDLQLAPTLNALREALIAASKERPCFDAIRTDEPFVNTFAIGFRVQQDASVQGGLKLLLGVVAAGVEAGESNVADNLITVSFAPREEPRPVTPRRPREETRPREPGPGGWRVLRPELRQRLF